METKDGTVNPKDTSQNADSSKGKQGTSKGPETFTSEQVAASSKKASLDALSAAGRTVQLLEKREVAVKASEDRLVQERQTRREAEIKASQDEPGKIDDIRAKHRAEDTNTEVAKLRQELEAEKEKGKQRDIDAVQTTQESSTRALAASLTVNPDTLVTLSKLTDGSKAAIEAMAQGLPKMGDKAVLLTDSGKTGGDGSITVEMVKNMSPQELMERSAEIAKLPLGL